MLKGFSSTSVHHGWAAFIQRLEPINLEVLSTAPPSLPFFFSRKVLPKYFTKDFWSEMVLILMEGFVDVELARDGTSYWAGQSKQLQTSPETFCWSVIKEPLAEWPEECLTPGRGSAQSLVPSVSDTTSQHLLLTSTSYCPPLLKPPPPPIFTSNTCSPAGN